MVMTTIIINKISTTKPRKERELKFLQFCPIIHSEQGVHEVASFVAMPSQYKQDPAVGSGWYVPGGHGLQWEARVWLKVPRGHGKQLEASGRS